MPGRKENSSNNINRKVTGDRCGMVYALNILSGRWKLLILFKLEDNAHHVMRFRDLKQAIPQISERMLTLQLKELERDQLIRRKVYAEVPPRVEYELSEYAKLLAPIWKQLNTWGDIHRNGTDNTANTDTDTDTINTLPTTTK
ncbi:helix-turn-helix transcriptional regulator [Chitinophaga pendula]|uniref:winged helix-turn-helix transcriptional regulator n=1 Tax=Chitinophaga TaxID=79328 RepID=UPI000BAECE12|nr:MULTISPECIES: helix-turn-helix domain-containing protein [Chitinophaga]ASZ14175.1 transcriptional regulator [Chitinophaga sp. MD30]UCJ08189.1 helix-turn-helix transcriptional regulator [Chitinophaga pendula]